MNDLDWNLAHTQTRKKAQNDFWYQINSVEKASWQKNKKRRTIMHLIWDKIQSPVWEQIGADVISDIQTTIWSIDE